MAAGTTLARTVLAIELAGGFLLAVTAAVGLSAFSSGDDSVFVLGIVAVAALWAGLLAAAAVLLPSRAGVLGACAGQVPPLAVVAVYVEAPGGLAVAVVAVGLLAQAAPLLAPSARDRLAGR